MVAFNWDELQSNNGCTSPMDNIDRQEISRFSAQAEMWWDVNGQFKALHQINPTRLAYVIRHADVSGKRVLDVGCGGGLLSEAIAAAGGRVTGIDMSAPALEVAARHAGQTGLAIDYRQSTAENWARSHAGAYDVITCMELVEHVPEPAGLVAACGLLLRPGGDLFFATVNRTWLARLLVIWLAEYVLGIVARGTHTYSRFVRPDELIHWGRLADVDCLDVSGLRYVPYIGHAALCTSTAMNYLMHLRKTGPHADLH